MFGEPPVTVNARGEAELSGRDALPWAVETLDVAGEIRSRYVRLQDWVRGLLAGRSAQ